MEKKHTPRVARGKDGIIRTIKKGNIPSLLQEVKIQGILLAEITLETSTKELL
ncbi:hypothetical protein ACM55G_14640 [Flavobacterium sp. LB3P122]|uniref:hypothetical protein n=1 Tax=Flavobacterium algoriphilum TaxID=3398738 RepID=UPI003A83CF7F